MMNISVASNASAHLDFTKGVGMPGFLPGGSAGVVILVAERRFRLSTEQKFPAISGAAVVGVGTFGAVPGSDG